MNFFKKERVLMEGRRIYFRLGMGIEVVVGRRLTMSVPQSVARLRWG